MYLCRLLGHNYRYFTEELEGFTQHSLACQRCAERVVFPGFNPIQDAPKEFKKYWDDTGTPFLTRVKEWRHRRLAVITKALPKYQERSIKRAE